MLDPVRVRFRDDGWIVADDAAAFIRGDKLLFNHPVEELIGIEPAKPGDIWRSRWYASELRDGQYVQVDGPLAGYAICCPKCLHVHSWNQATNCVFELQPREWTKLDGTVESYNVCGHNGKGSCWNWTGSAEDGTLSASPSLHSNEAKGGCGWHGFLTNGLMKHC